MRSSDKFDKKQDSQKVHKQGYRILRFGTLFNIVRIRVRDGR